MANWRQSIDESNEIILSNQINISRNLKGIKYPNLLDRDEAYEINDKINQIIESYYPGEFVNMKTSDLLFPKLLLENKIISDKLIENEKISSFSMNKDQTVNLMNNEEDHINVRVLRPGGDIVDSFDLAKDIISTINKEEEFSYHPDYGYLTSSPNKVGTGLKITVTLHLPGIFYSGYIADLVKDLNNFGIFIQGNFGGKFEYTGNIFEITNLRTLGMTEEELLYKMKSVSDHIADSEKYIIERFSSKYPIFFEDAVYRSIGVLKYSKQISEKEAIGAISNIRTGIGAGVYKGLNMKQVTDLYFNVKKENIKKYKKELNLDLSENQARSLYIEEYFKEVEISA